MWAFVKNKLDRNINRLKSISSSSRTSIVIKTPVTKWSRAHSWGDYHMAEMLRDELMAEGYNVLIQILPEWDNKEGNKYDVVIVFRGLSRYYPKDHQINFMWNISHPDKVDLEEYEGFDKVFIASNYWAGEISKRVSVPVEAMLQCTDLKRFKLPNRDQINKNKHQILFVANSRDTFRAVLKPLIPTQYNLAVYGKNWKKFIPKRYIKGEYIKNNELYLYYGSADILLNDHWEDMREKGFVSNRIFDGLASGAFILSDNVRDMGEIESYLQVYKTPEELNQKVEYYLNNFENRLLDVDKQRKYVAENHTFKQRAIQFINAINDFKNKV